MQNSENNSATVMSDVQETNWVSWAFYAIAAVICGLLLFNIMTLPLGRDQATFSVIGKGMLEGIAPYSESWDIKTPGIFFVYSFAHALFGGSEFAPRVLEGVAMVLMGFGFVKLSQGLVDRRAATLGFVLALYCMVVFGFWHTGQPETFAAVVLIWAVVATQRSWFFAVGALYLFAAFLKPSFAGGILVSFAFAIMALPSKERTLRRVFGIGLSFAAGGLAVVALVLGYLWLCGALPAFLWTMFSFVPNYLGDVSTENSRSLAVDGAKTLFRFAKLWPILVVGGALCLFWGLKRPELGKMSIHLAGVALFPLIGVALQGKFFPYHFVAAVGPVALMAGWGLWLTITEGTNKRAIQAFIVLAVCVLAVLPRPSQRFWTYAADRVATLGLSQEARAEKTAELFSTNSFDRIAILEVAEWIDANLSEAETVYVWGFDPSIYLLTDTYPPTRYISNFPQRVDWSADASRQELLEDLEAAPPSLIIVSRTDTMRAVTGNLMDSRAVLDAEFVTLRQFLEKRYTLVQNIRGFDLYGILDGGGS